LADTAGELDMFEYDSIKIDFMAMMGIPPELLKGTANYGSSRDFHFRQEPTTTIRSAHAREPFGGDGNPTDTKLKMGTGPNPPSGSTDSGTSKTNT
jgi:hypothetical protein